MASEKIAIDLDGLTTSIYKVGSGMVLSEPTVAAVGLTDRNQLKAVGESARKLVGKTAENTKIIFPVFEGEIVNEKVAAKLLNSFLRKIDVLNKIGGIEGVVGVPCGISAEMLEKYENVIKNAGVNKIHFVEAPLLSALGMHLPLSDSTPFFVIDMAGGTTNIAVLSLDGIIAGISVNFGANKISTDIIDYVADVYGLQIGLLSAERIKKDIGSLAEDDALSMAVNGRDIMTGTPRSVVIRAMDLIEPVKQYYDKIADLAMSVLIKLPPEVSAEIRHSGIYVSGVSATVYGLDKYLEKRLGMRVVIAENPEMNVALGGGVAISNPSLIKKIEIDVD